MINQNDDLILQQKLDKPDSSEADRLAADLCRKVPSAKNEQENYLKLFHRLEKHFSPGPEDQPDAASIDGLMTKIFQHNEPQNQYNFLPGWMAFNNLFRFAAGGAFALLIVLVFLYVKQPTMPVSPTLKSGAESFSVAKMSVFLAPESENDLTLDGEICQVTSGSTLKSQKSYALKNAAELAISSTYGMISFKNQASFAIQDDQIKLDTGYIYCNLKGNHQNFRIITPFGSVAPIGTKFSVTVRPDYVKICLFAGKVLVTSAKGVEKIISDDAPVFILPDGHFSENPVRNEAMEPQRKPVNQAVPANPDSDPKLPQKNPDTILDTL